MDSQIARDSGPRNPLYQDATPHRAIVKAAPAGRLIYSETQRA